MKPKMYIQRIICLVLLYIAFTANLAAQCSVNPVATGLQAPTKIISAASYLLIAEAGFGPNMGRVSVLDPANGQVWTLVDGLPAGFSPPNSDPSGPSGLALVGNTLYVTIGLGDAIIAGSAPGTQVANPNPSSQLFSSVLAFDLGSQGKAFRGGFSLTTANQASLASYAPARLRNSYGDTVTARLVANFPDFVSEPVPNEPANVRQRNPFGIVAIDNLLYVPDASSNDLLVVDSNTGAFRTLTTFAPFPNPLPFGAPVVEAVPNSIRRFGDSLLVTLLTGFPFPAGAAKVIVVDPITGSQTPLVTGLSSAIDVMPVKSKGNLSLLTLEFSSDMLNGTPGTLKLFATPTSEPTTVPICLITPTSMAQDKSGKIYITEIFTGSIRSVTLQ
jgi:hypothetical protein